MNVYYDPYWNLNDDELEHFGILGMKWGIRRYQNKDGTLTDAGKKRYGTAENLKADQERKQIRNQKITKAAKTTLKISAAIGLGAISAGLLYTGYDTINYLIKEIGSDIILVNGREVPKFKGGYSSVGHDFITGKTLDASGPYIEITRVRK